MEVSDFKVISVVTKQHCGTKHGSDSSMWCAKQCKKTINDKEQ